MTCMIRSLLVSQVGLINDSQIGICPGTDGFGIVCYMLLNKHITSQCEG